MFESLQDGIRGAMKSLRGKGKLTEANMRDGLALVEQSLLEADVSYDVVKDFMASVSEQALGRRVMLSLDPSEEVVAIVRDELVKILGPVVNEEDAGSGYAGAVEKRLVNRAVGFPRVYIAADDPGIEQAVDAEHGCAFYRPFGDVVGETADGRELAPRPFHRQQQAVGKRGAAEYRTIQVVYKLAVSHQVAGEPEGNESIVAWPETNGHALDQNGCGRQHIDGAYRQARPQTCGLRP